MAIEPGDIGKAEIEVTADTSHFAESTRRGVESELHKTDPSFEKAGKDWGETLGQAIDKRLKEKVPEIARDLAAELHRQHITEHVEVSTDVDKDHVRKFVRNLADTIENEAGGSGGGNIFNKIGQGFADAVGSGFNVSGKSPLIFLLIPLIGAIGALILAAIEGVYGLAAALLTLPSIIAAIIAQVGVMFLIFKAVAPVISAVLSAQNAKELQTALMGVNPAIAAFAKSLIPIKEFFDLLGKSAAVEFFQALGSTVKDIFNANSRTFFFGVLEVAKALGTFFATIGKAFQSVAFNKFLKDLFDSISHFLGRDGPYFEQFLEKLFGWLDALLPAATTLGALFDLLLKTFGDWLAESAKDPKFLDWLENKMPILLLDLADALGSIIDLVITLFNDIDKQGGQGFLENFTVAVKELNLIFQSDAGQKAIRALIELIEILALSFFALIVVIVSVLAFLEQLKDWVGQALPAIGEFFAGLGKKIAEFFGPENVKKLYGFVKDAFQAIIDDAPGWGRALINGFIQGIKDRIPSLQDVLHYVAGEIGKYLPHSPAKVGPLSGDGSPYARGTAMVRDFSRGIMAASDQVNTATSNAMSNVNFGTGAVIANFYGAQPSPDQARNLGTAVGSGIGDQLLQRNVRLAVRTM